MTTEIQDTPSVSEMAGIPTKSYKAWETLLKDQDTDRDAIRQAATHIRCSSNLQPSDVQALLKLAANRLGVTPTTLTKEIRTALDGEYEVGLDVDVGIIEEFNETHAMVLAGDTACVIREGASEFGGAKVNFLKKSDLLTFYANQLVSAKKTDRNGGQESVLYPLAKLWLEHPKRRSYEGVTFAPDGKAPTSFYNLWRGFAVQSLEISLFRASRRCRRLMHHIKYNLCRGNSYHFRYLLAWMADMIQDPGRKKGVVLVLRGRKGTGKSKLAEVLQAICGGHAFKASKAAQIVGQFSGHLADKLLIIAEESFFAGSKADIGTLKDMTTSGTITIEPKGISAFEMRSCHRIMMVTNNDWAVPATADERRFFVLDVGEGRMQDSDYFAALDDELYKEGGLESFMTVLSKLDISKVNLRKVPQTDALRKQKILSLDPQDQFILDILANGEVCGKAWEMGESDLVKTDLYEAYEKFARARGGHPQASNRFSPRFELVTGASTYQPTAGADRRRRYVLPGLDEAINRFAKEIGVSRLTLGL